MRISRRTPLLVCSLTLVCMGLFVRVRLIHPKEAESGGAGLTIYNQQFAVVRQTMPLNLKAGVNHVEVTDITGHLEPDSVICGRSMRGGS